MLLQLFTMADINAVGLLLVHTCDGVDVLEQFRRDPEDW
jgi:hypothetical protein